MPLFLCLGPEEFRKREFLASVLQKYQFSLKQLQSYHSSSVNLSEIHNILLSPPLFGDIPPVLLTDIDLLGVKQQRNLARICTVFRKSAGKDTLFFLFSREYRVSNALNKVFPKSNKNEQKVFWELSEDEKVKHVIAFCHKSGRSIEPSAVTILLERVSTDVLALEHTLATVFLYLGEGSSQITEELLSRIFMQSRDESVYDLFHHMVERNLGRSLEIIGSLLLQGSSKAASIIIQLLYQWDKLLQIKERMRFASFEEACRAEQVRTKTLKADMRRGVEEYSLQELRSIQKINQDYSLNIKLAAGLQDTMLKHYIYQALSA